ncbi:unnamed protein product [Ixodes hexagonus]
MVENRVNKCAAKLCFARGECDRSDGRLPALGTRGLCRSFCQSHSSTIISDDRELNITRTTFSVTESYSDALIKFVSRNHRQGIISGF